MPRLLTLDEAANELGVPPGSLRSAAARHGLLVRMGRAIRVDPNDLPELIRSCQDKRKAPDCTAVEAASGPSATRADDSSQRALATAERLKGLSRGTSPERTGPPGQLHRIK